MKKSRPIGLEEEDIRFEHSGRLVDNAYFVDDEDPGTA